MKIVLQRVKEATVEVDKKIIGQIGKGMVVFLGVECGDNILDVDYLVKKLINLRIFNDGLNKFNYSIADINGSFLVVSQFTLAGSCEKGRRPSFNKAEAPEKAEKLYELFIEKIKKNGFIVESGKFSAMMDVILINDGPVTFILESKK